ncbi:MAG TPA: phosphatidylinositol-specific phospholipase C/glycerophosphodiester phosphodiesterase family protein [Pirellulales bacterium]|nr:phosphatidylinositol-specific phospholipase C/glycerophosphodiester phosphodiesterase family protein [Pirellulales bacterium]
MAIFIVAALALGGSWASGAETTKVAPLSQAHAHNDYLHSRPLLDALDHGFTSVEADIFLVDGKLLIGHTKSDLDPPRTLELLYLDPLRARVRAGQGSVYPGGGAFQLLIDIKSVGEATYVVLAKVLAEYADIVSVVRDGQLEPKAVNVVISGNRPREMMAAETVRYAGLDGRLGDLDSDATRDFLPLISDNWALHFKWKGEGPMSDADRKKLHDIVAKAHAHGRKIRLWATPDNVNVWRELRASGVDMINTDDLAGLEKFLRGAGQN